jgi:phosphatidylserine decarboxylase
VKKTVYRSFVELTGSPLVSNVIKTFATSKWSKKIVPSFARTFQINQVEMDKQLHEYESLHQFFIRSLKRGARQIHAGENSLVSPVDGVLAKFGKVTGNNTFHVKGQDYSLNEMVGSEENAEKYKSGTYLILYLSPRHYHRIHSPVSGTVISQNIYGKKSYPVNEAGLTYGVRPLSKNYRVVTEMDCNGKTIAVVKVGALNINTIETTHETNELKKGEEIGYFSFGSTVVLLLEPGTCELLPQLRENREVKMGEKIGTLLSVKE